MNLMQLLGVKSKETLGGRYKVIQPLGQGGFGHTFLATDLHLPDQPTCVIKQLKPHLRDAQSLATARRLFETEARVLYQLGTHNQIPRLLAHFEDGQEFYLAQELIEGDSLSNLIQPGRPWSEAQVRQLLREILTPLAFVHGQGVIHRDLKPSNLIYRHDGHIVLIDFGAVKQVSEQRTSGEATRTISIGTQGYMPNEQLAGNPWFSSDIYAAGMICLQALTGTAPHLLPRDPRTSEVLWQSPDLDISEEFKAVLARMVRYDYRERYGTAADILADLDTLPELPREPIAPSTSSLPTQVIAPGKPSGSAAFPQPSGTASNGQTLAVEKMGLPVISRSLQTITKATVAAVPTLLANKPVGRLSMVGLSVATVVALGLMRNGQTSANLASQPTEVEPAPVETAASVNSETTPERPDGETQTPTGTAAPEVKETTPPAAAPAAAIETSSFTQAVAPAGKPDELLAKAQELRDRNQYNDALQTYNQLLESSPNQAEAHWGKCYSLNQLQDYAGAVQSCDRALELAPDSTQALWSKGYALEQQGQPQAALELYGKVLQLDPNHSEAWNNLGAVKLKQQRFQEALAAFDRAREIDPNLAEVWSNRGVALWELRQFDAAIASIDKAIALQPDYPEAQSLREQIRQKLGR